MGRSKFPGKPSKHVNRKRVNVLPPTQDTIIECSRSLTVETVVENKQAFYEVKNDQNINLNNSIASKVSLRLNRKMQGSKVLISNNTSKRSLMSKICNKNGVKAVTNKIALRSKINCKGSRNSSVPRKTGHGYSNIKNFKPCRSGIPKESNNLVGKFVLPTRSVHSSRVIKPNKRFINVDLSETITLKKKVVNKRHCIKPDQENQPKKVSEHDILDNSAKELFSNGRVVLRQARLKLHTQTPSGSEGPFSSKSTNGSPPGTVTCGVCGAVRFYRFVKQARKFNIYSCESCRKFISKMIKRQSCGNSATYSTLVCHKGQGMCHVPPIVRSQQMKLIRCAYRSRCPACWLKMCLRSFQMPMSLKHSLVQLLPKNMQGADVIFNNSLPLLWQGNVQNIDNRIRDSENAPNESVNQRPVRFKNTKPLTPQNVTQVSDIKRQKVDLKGPRVKHVCRSASIVLGQPIATFPAEIDKKKIEIKESVIDGKKNDDIKISSSSNDSNEDSMKSIKADSNFSENESSDSDRLPKIPLILNDTLISQIKRDKNQRVPFPIGSTATYDSKLFPEKKQDFQHNMISLDYWENFDPDDISQNGFCLIASQQFPMPAICFLCGSAGREALLHCSLCCEPYHPFCLEQSPPINNNNNRQFMWLCPRCTMCSACKRTDRQKINCQKCSKAYHSECFNSNRSDVEKSIVCSKCLTCRGCGEENKTKFVGNLALCVMCFKSRRKGVNCPICTGSYDEADFNEKMMECTQCNQWIHARCDGLSEEYYHILSILPESVKYLCVACSKHSIPYWRKAVESELKFCFNQILRLLSKNKIAKNMLKLSPLNNRISINKAVNTVRKIQFYNDGDLDADVVPQVFFNDCNKNFVIENGVDESPTKNKVLSMLDIKNKLNSNEYHSVRDFNREIEQVLNHTTQSEELLNIYHVIFKSVFPWYEHGKTDGEIRFDNNQDGLLLGSEADESMCSPLEYMGADSRYCSFCKSIGDGLSHLESRLLYCGYNEWVHINCALWSSEVYEEIDGSLQNVHSALSRGRLMRCSYCKQKGATVGCCFKNCYESYHFICARTAKCYFMYDKTIYCSNHELPKGISVMIAPREFDIRRLVFIELSDNKKVKSSQVDKVNIMVGSLRVTNIGKINLPLSDSEEAIIPTGYVCSRLYWSTVKPWKLVAYKVTTSILNAHVGSQYIDKNFTVDHSLPKSAIDRRLKEIALWQRDVDRKKLDVVEFEDEEEPQNGADLLSPEITDAIFEELPRELLDGISVQDIFPKLMSYEDCLNLDTKSETTNSDIMNHDLKKGESESENLAEFDEKDLKYKFDSDVINKSKIAQRSCSLTLSCKLDNNFSPVMKKRKITPRENNLFLQLLQVDGAFDDSSSSECGSPIGEGIPNVWSNGCLEEPVTCERCRCTYRTQASYKRHLDTCEVLCSSESDSELNQDPDGMINLETSAAQLNVLESSTLLLNVNENAQPLLTTTTCESYQNEIHTTSVLNTQTFVTSKSTSELISVPQNPEIIISNANLAINQKSTVQHQPVPQLSEAEEYTVNRSNLALNEPVSVQTNQFCLNQTMPICVNPSSFALQTMNPASTILTTGTPLLNQAISINQSGSISMNQPTTVQQPLEFQQAPVSVAIQQLPYPNNVVAPIINVTPQNNIIGNGNFNSMVAQGIPVNRWIKPIGKSTVFQSKDNKGRGRTIAAKRQIDNDTYILPHGNNHQSTQSMIVQHLPSTNFLPTFVDTYQQQSGQNLQYVTTIAPQTVHSQPLMQLQAENNLISFLPGMQPTMIIQQPRVVENQLVLDSNGSLSWAQQQIQPVFYGFETIVQNTVMQSQQFLPSPVPGVLTANSSYSTTTQVFQTSKLEPVLDVATNSFVILNPGQLVNSPSIQINSQNAQVQPINNVIQTTNVNPTSNYPRPTLQKNNTIASSTVNSNSIHLPTTPFVSEQRIPTNIVTPTPKISTPTTQSRPMSRVLPMQTVKESSKVELQLKKNDVVKKDLVDSLSKTAIEPIGDFVKSIAGENIKKPIQVQLETECHLDVTKNESLKLLFQKQTQDGTYKVSTNNNFIEKPVQLLKKDTAIIVDKTNYLNIHNKPSQESVYNFANNLNCKNSTVKVAPLKPIKSNYMPPILPLSEKQNRQPEKVEKKESTCSNKSFPSEKKESENMPSIIYTIETEDGFKYSSTSLAELWKKVCEAVQNARAAHNMPLIPPDSTNVMNNLQILGLKTVGLRYLIEQLPGASKCTKYKPCFNFPIKYIEVEDEPIGHSNGCARCAPNIKRNDPYDMFGWLASKHRKPEQSLIDSDLFPRRSSVNNLPMAMRFRQLKLTSKYSVGVYRSKIHRRGLFCLRDFEAGEMVIEYSGEVIRSILTDKREKFYNSKSIGCYMFRIDDNLVVDATMTGNAARFINHSCDPNCYSKVVEILGHKHIIIFALRRIICGEELTYDYKFPIEEDKIPCTCGARRCRKFLN